MKWTRQSTERAQGTWLWTLLPILMVMTRTITAGDAGSAGRPTGPRHVLPPGSYAVQLAFTGYTGLSQSVDCNRIADRKGYDSLVGTVTGIETPDQPGEEVVYTGTLRRVTKLDYCQTTGRRSPDDDEQVWCRATLTGAARLAIRLTVYGDEGEGAYVEVDSVPGKADSVKVEGSCDRPAMDEIKADYPSGESGGSPDGQPIAEVRPPKFIVNRIPKLRIGYFPPDSVRGGWGLRVVSGPS